jgi:uncharacterized protein
VLFGAIIAVFLVAWGLLYAREGAEAVRPRPEADPASVASLHPSLVAVLAWSFPLGYAAGGLFAVVVLRKVVGPVWAREAGLRRLPLTHLGLGLLALPAFSVASDGLAVLLYRAFGVEHLLDQAGELGTLFAGFHPLFVLLAIGVGPGVVEELWCRGFLGRGLVGRYGWAVGVVLSSSFFGLLHLWPPPYVILTAVMGLALHFAYACSRSLGVPIAVHAANNGFAGLAAVGAVPVGGMDRALAAYPAVTYGLAAVVLLTCGWAAWTGRAVAAGPRGVMVPPGGVTDRRPHPLPTLAALAAAAALLALFAIA